MKIARMRLTIRNALFALAFALTVAALLAPMPAGASFHIMVIDEVMAGTGGDANIQFVELKMQASGQNFVSGTKLLFYDAAGTKTATFTFPSNVSSGANGASVLIGTTQFANASSATPDFTMPINVNAPDGRVCFTYSNETTIIDCVAYGNFSGTNSSYGSAAAGLPISGNSSLKRATNTNNNANDFSLGTPAPRNNTGQAGSVTPPDTKVPVLASAAVNGTSLVFTYTELNGLDTGSTPATTDFSIGTDGAAQSVTGVVVGANTVTLTLSPGVANGDTITVSYTAGVNPIQDGAGNVAANLINEPVTNNTPPPPPPPTPTPTPTPTPIPALSTAGLLALAGILALLLTWGVRRRKQTTA